MEELLPGRDPLRPNFESEKLTYPSVESVVGPGFKKRRQKKGVGMSAVIPAQPRTLINGSFRAAIPSAVSLYA
jgi:hypothetical protein